MKDVCMWVMCMRAHICVRGKFNAIKQYLFFIMRYGYKQTMKFYIIIDSFQSCL